ATLGYFKYFNFGIETFKTLTGYDSTFIHVILPIGVSFFIFHAISYIVDVWRNDTPATKKLFDFAAFISLFPHLIAGPVLKYKDLSHQFENRTHTFDKFSEGAYRFMIGFAKIKLIEIILANLENCDKNWHKSKAFFMVRVPALIL
ncbi:MAG: hypothetical protein SFU99_22860, partial [Saprospiraceae bacterium]|nr:hypothetical protein [Saprospiraceae bacterium]